MHQGGTEDPFTLCDACGRRFPCVHQVSRYLDEPKGMQVWSRYICDDCLWLAVQNQLALAQGLRKPGGVYARS